MHPAVFLKVRVMINQLEEFRVSIRQEYSGEWTDSASKDDPSAPVAVRLNVKAAGRHWPDLIMQVQH